MPLMSLVAPSSLSASGGLSDAFLRVNVPLQMTSVVPFLAACTDNFDE
jgi:hypothetical protein